MPRKESGAPLYPEAMPDTPAPNDPGHALSEVDPITVADPHAVDPTAPTAAEVAQANLEAKEAAAPDELDAALAVARQAQLDAIAAKEAHDAAAAEAEVAFQEAVDKANKDYLDALAADQAEDAVEPAPEPPVPEAPFVSDEDASQDARITALEEAEAVEKAAEQPPV